MEHARPIIDNILLCLMPYKHSTMESVFTDESIETSFEKYAISGVVATTNLLTNCLVFNIECAAIAADWCYFEYQELNKYMNEKMNEYNGGGGENDYVDVDANVDVDTSEELDLSGNETIADKKND